MIKQLISPRELKEVFPLSSEQKTFIVESRTEACNILLGQSSKKIVVCGPCSVHDFDLLINYANELSKISEKVKESLFIVLRAYIEKPRTHPGFKGFVYQPYQFQQENLALGLELSRKLFLRLIDLRIPVSMEILEPNLFHYFSDLLTWGFIGARTSSSQIHRQIASYAKFPIGFKNTLDGNINLAIEGINFARTPQHFFSCNEDGKLSWTHSQGNPYTHLVLRGSLHQTNYDKSHIEKAYKTQQSYNIKTPIMIDCSHGNSNKNPQKQKEVFIHSLKHLQDPDVLGFMIESHLYDETSITDPCLSLQATENLLYLAHRHSFQNLVSLAN